MGFREQALILLVASTLLFASGMMDAQATNRYVPAEFLTIQAAIDAALPGDTIFVSPGSYNERLVVHKTLRLVGTSRATTFIDGQTMGTPVFINASNVEITGFTLGNGDPMGKAVFVTQANNVTIVDNTIAVTPQGDGINLDRSNNTRIIDNVFNLNLYAINVTGSEMNRIEGNRMLSGTVIGLQLLNSHKNNVHNNTITNGEEGIDIVSSNQNNVTRNLIRRMSIAGLFLLDFPTGNRFSENTLQINHIGVNLQNATGNSFYHNNILASEFRQVNHVVASDLGLNVWDNRSLGPILGGNYWDDYQGLDDGSGGRVAGDGIGDTGLPAAGVDAYPLMAPFVPIPLALVRVVASRLTGPAPLTVSLSVTVLGTSTPFSYEWNFGDGTPHSTARNETHTFAQQGNFTVRVRVADSTGASEVASVLIMVVTITSGSMLSPWAVVGVVGGVVAVLVAFLLLRRRRMVHGSGQRVIVPKKSLSRIAGLFSGP